MPKSHRTKKEPDGLRRRIAREAARLIARRKVRNFHTARVRAMRWLSQQRLESSQVPTQEEVMQELEALTLTTDWNSVPPILPEQGEAELCADAGSETQWGELFRPLLESLAKFQWDYETHPEGDALFHSLQVYTSGKQLHPWDEEFLWACLLHDIGFVVDPRQPVQAAVRILESRVTPRLLFLIEHLDIAHDYLQGSQLPRWIRKEESVEELIDLARCDRQGRVPGAQVPSLDQVLQELNEMQSAFD